MSSLTSSGFLCVFVSVFLAIGAINGQNNLLFWLFGVFIGSLAVSGLVTGNAMMGLRLVAHPVGDTECGLEFRVGYTLINESRIFPNFALEVYEVLGKSVSGDVIEPVAQGVVAHLPPGGTGRTRSVYRSVRRGECELEKVRVRCAFPFGLFVKSVEFDAPRRFLVYPERVESSVSEEVERDRDSELSRRALSRRGSGMEYLGLREYRSGDPIRSISWKRSVRGLGLVVMEFPEPESDYVVVRILRSRRVDPAAFERALSIAYTLIVDAPGWMHVGLVMDWSGVVIGPGRGSGIRSRCARALALASMDRVEGSVGSRGFRPSIVIDPDALVGVPGSGAA